MNYPIHSPLSRLVTILLCVFGIGTASAGLLSTDPANTTVRHTRVTVYPLYQYWDSEHQSVHYTDPDNMAGGSGQLTFKVDTASAFGFGFGYDLNDHLSFNGELTWAHPNYSMEFQNVKLTGEARMTSGLFGVEYNLLAKKFTPFIGAGLGFLYVDTGIPAGPTGTYCWWDYWWGYVCTGVTPTYANTYWSTDAALGVRWDPNDQLFFKASISWVWADTNNDAGWREAERYNFAFGWKY